MKSLIRYAFWIAFMMAMIALSECASSQVLPFDSTRPASYKTLAPKWEDPQFFIPWYVRDAAVPMDDVMDSLRVESRLKLYWKYYCKMLALSVRGADLNNNRYVARMMKSAMGMHKHPVFVYYYSIAAGDFRTMDHWLPYLEKEAPELYEDLKVRYERACAEYRDRLQKADDLIFDQ
jgi:hypothetical protein